MKSLKAIINFLIFALSSNAFAQKHCQNIAIGKNMYSICITSSYIHDDDLMATYFVVYKSVNKKEMCSGFMLAKRNNSVVIKGSYTVDKNRISFKEVYFNSRNKISNDSLTKEFYPDRHGNLILSQVTQYFHGKATVSNY
jgi:hypothetical protein